MKLFMTIESPWDTTFEIVRADSLEAVQKKYFGREIIELETEGPEDVVWSHIEWAPSSVE